MSTPRPALRMNQRIQYGSEPWWVYGIHATTNRYTWDNNQQIWTICYDLSSKPPGMPYDAHSRERFLVNVPEAELVGAQEGVCL